MPRVNGHSWAFALILIITLAFSATRSRAQNIISTGDYWTYWDFGYDPDPYWTDPNFDDFEWSLGPSPLGFGEPYIVTTVQQGIMTAYFRHYFYLDEPP